MATPTGYSRGTSFTDAQAADPASPLSGPGVDAEFDRIQVSISSLVTALAQIQRADGELANESVGADQISPEVYAGLQPAEVWVTGTGYAVRDTVFYSSGADVMLYRCETAHTASADFDLDLAAGYWTLLADFTPPAVAGIIGVDAGGTGADNATDARTNLGLGSAAIESVVPISKGGTGATSASLARSLLGLEIGTQVQAADIALAVIAAAPKPAADTMHYYTGVSTGDRTALTAFARTLLDDADAATARATLSAMNGGTSQVTDWNSAITNGVYQGADTATNGPSAHYYRGMVWRTDASSITQVLSRGNGEGLWQRRMAGGVWQSWVEFVHAGNIDAQAKAIGVGQTWQNVKASRAAGTSYQNTTGKPIMVAISVSNNTAALVQVSVDNATWVDVGTTASANSNNQFIVPDDYYYRLQSTGSPTIDKWAELR
jgi:hypothetical protein